MVLDMAWLARSMGWMAGGTKTTILRTRMFPVLKLFPLIVSAGGWRGLAERNSFPPRKCRLQRD